MAAKSKSSDFPSIPGYELLERIAEGSMAVVYRGRWRKDGTQVAIKIPRPEVASNDVLAERFRKEYRVGKKLRHPNIVRTIDFGEANGSWFLVQEFMEGGDMWKRIQKHGRLPERTAVEMIVQAAHGLHEAHKQGIIHRDVKPDNILLTASGQAKLGDLGLIKEQESDLTRPQKGLGTPHFMAPEQFSEARLADVRCDVYSLGASLYNAVTGVLPFDARTIAVLLRKKTNNELRAPREIVPELSEAVDWTIRRSLQADPLLRPATCLDLIHALTGETAAPVVKPRRSSGGVRVLRSGEDRRQSVRYPCTVATVCELPVSIHGEESESIESWPGKLMNLSVAGAGLLLERRLEVGTVVMLSLKTSNGSFQTQIQMRIVRVVPSDDQWFIGAVFLTHLNRLELRKFL